MQSIAKFMSSITFAVAHLLSGLGSAHGAAQASLVRLYVYKLPVCSFDSLLFEEPSFPFLSIHNAILNGTQQTTNPAEANLFYMPAPFSLWEAAVNDADVPAGVLQQLAVLPRPHTQYMGPRKAHGTFSVSGVADWGVWTAAFWAFLPAGLRSEAEHTSMIVLSLLGASRTYKFGFVSDCFEFLVCSDGGESRTGFCDRGFDFNSWHHYAVAYDGERARLYVDGSLVGWHSGFLKMCTSTGNIFSGPNDCISALPFQGSTRQVQIFNVSLNQEQLNLVRLDPQSHKAFCFQILRSYIENSKWLERNMGWDHFYVSHRQRACGIQSALESSWPAFSRFAALLVTGDFSRCSGADCAQCYKNIVTPPFSKSLHHLQHDVFFTSKAGTCTSFLTRPTPKNEANEIIASTLQTAMSAVGMDKMGHVHPIDQLDQSEMCFLVAEDPSMISDLFRAMYVGCIPIIVCAYDCTLSQLPFIGFVPWHDFSIFWNLNHSGVNSNNLTLSAIQLISDLADLNAAGNATSSPSLLAEKRHSLWKWVGIIGWHSAGIDLVVKQLSRRSSFLGSLSNHSFAALQKETINLLAPLLKQNDPAVCPLGYPSCENHGLDPDHGDLCKEHSGGVGWSCPRGCVRVFAPPFCASPASNFGPCRTTRCDQQSSGVLVDSFAFKSPQICLISFSNRPRIRAFTWPKLQEFVLAFPGRYHLELYSQSMLGDLFLHPAWNKLVLVRQALLSGKYEAVVWVDDDILITDTSRDPIYEAMVSLLLPFEEKLILASHDEQISERFPLNTGLLVVKKSEKSLVLIDNVFDIANDGKTYTLNGTWLQPAFFGYWEQDAFAVYVNMHGKSEFALVEHGLVQSFARPGDLVWQPGDFAAHLTGLRSVKQRLRFMWQFSRTVWNRSWDVVV